MRRFPLLLTLALLPFVASADSPPRAKMEVKYKQYDVKMRDFNFPSGLRIIFQEDHSQPIVSITSVIDRGSTSDPEGLEGIAHLCEHMWFRSKQKDADGKQLPKVWDLLREMGANLNASTADDWTNYMTVAPIDKIIPLLRLESIRMKSAGEGVENDVLLTEREVVRNELRMRYENAIGAAFGYMMVKLFPSNHVYGRTAYAGIGNNDSLNAITLPDVQKFFKDNYGPANTTIVVVGDFKLEDTGKFLDEFALEQLTDPAHPTDEIKLVEPKARVAATSAEPPAPPSPLLVKGDIAGLTTEHGAVEKPTLVLGWTLPGGYRDYEPMMQMAAIQLQIAIRQEMNPSWDYKQDHSEIESLGCFVQPQKEASIAWCFVEIADEKDAVRLAERALDGLYRVWSADEYYRAFQEYLFSYSKTQQLAAVFQSVDLVSSIGNGRAADTANFVHYTGDPLYYSRQFEWINKISADQARKLAEKYLNRSRASAVLMLPYEEGDLAMDTSDAQYRGARREDVLDSMMTESQLSPAFIERAVIPPDVAKLRESTLPSGVKLVSMAHSDAPLVEVRLSFGGGQDSTDDGAATFASQMWKNESVVDALRIVGFDAFSVGGLTTQFEIAASAGNLEDALFVLRDRIDNLKPYTDGRMDWVKDQEGNILSWMKDPAEWATRTALERVLPNHPYSRWFNHSDFATMNKWSTSVSQDVFSHVLRPQNATLFIIGNASPEEASQAANTYFGAWEGWGKAPTDGKTLRTSYPAATEPPARQILLFNKDNSSQTNVSYTCQLGVVDDKNVAAAQLLGDALSEDTWLALREQTGSSYGAYASSSYLRGGVAFLNMASLVQNDASPLAAKVFLELGEKAKAGKISPKTLSVVKYNRAQGYVAGHQSTAQMMNRIASTFDLGWGSDFFKTYAKQLANVTIEQITPLMDRCVGHEIVSVVGPVDTIKPLFDKAGMKYEVFDWKQAKLDYATKHGLKDVLKADEKKKKEEAKKKDEKKK
ncbi:MAG: insulinase family protein [Pseudomonadota bacterium]|nr:insulinase family protein [Pseudomonadota bacterium]